MRALALSLLVVSVVFAAPVAAQTQPDYTALHNHLNERVTAARDRESRADEAVQRATRLTASAQAAGDQDAYLVAREALATAERTLRNARALRQRRERELNEFAQGIRDAVVAGRPVGYPVLWRRGEITVASQNGSRPFEGQSLRPGEAIRTGVNSAISFVTPDGSLLQLGPQSVLVAAAGRGAYVLSEGLFREVYKCIEGRSDCALNRRLAVRAPPSVSVRGTEYVVHVIDSAEVRLETLDGQVDILDSAGTVLTSVTRGQRILIRADGDRLRIVTDSTRAARWWLDF